jgi:cathepsin F
MSKAILFSILATATASASASASTSAPAVSKDDFQAWTQRHHKQYDTEAQRLHAFSAFVDNVHNVNAINNNPNSTWVATVENQFGDMTPHEFKELILSRPLIADDSASASRRSKTEMSSTERLGKRYLSKRGKRGDEQSFDWNEYGAVTQVQDQGSVGTCWAFSTIGNIEGQWFLSTDELVDLSEEYLVDCDGSRDDEANRADCSVFGGWPYLAYQFLIDAGGVPTEATNPYCCGTGDCYPCMNGPVSLCGPPPYYCDEEVTAACPNAKLYANISDWHYISSDEEKMKTDLEDIGPLSALLDASQLQHYKSGVWSGSSLGPVGCSKTSLNHAIVVTGYGQEAGTPYWTVKNSWGTRWGEDGYFKIVRGEGMCGINTEVTTSSV